MFDKIVVRPVQTEYVPYEKTIIEKRAPTDDSIRIFDEMKQKAFGAVVESILVNDNTINFAAGIFDDPQGYRKIFMYRLVVNGKLIEGDIKLEQSRIYSQQELIEAVFKALAESIAVDLMKVSGLFR